LIFLPVIQQEIARYKQEGQGFATQSELVEPVSITTPLLTVAANSGASGMASNSPVEPLPPAEVPAFVSTPAVAPASLPAANAADVNANATITFSAAGESWVKVTDAKGMVALNRTLRAGESAGVSGALPLTTVVGRANAIQVQVRGQAFDLGGVTKNNVARFEVK
jgi:cytoskeleton protein RodZ